MKSTLQPFLSSKLLDRGLTFLLPIIAVLAALLIGAVLLLLVDANPIEGYKTLYQRAIGVGNANPKLNINDRAETLVKATPLMFVGIGICIAFRGGVINVGGEGQMIIGAVTGTAVALQFQKIPQVLLDVPMNDFPQITIVTLSLLAGFIGGALWGGIAGYLKAYFNVNEILSTIMLNQIAFQIMFYLLKGPLQDPQQRQRQGGIAKTIRIPEHGRLPRLTWFIDPEIRTALHYGLIIAIILAVVVYIFLWRTTFGYRIRAVGKSERAARYAGIRVKRQMLYSMLLAGGFAGLAGIVQVLGSRLVLQTEGGAADFTDNAGFNGIVVALFGNLHPLGTIPAAIVFGGLLTGGKAMQRTIQVESSLITAINGLVVVFVVSSQIFIRRRSRQRVNTASTAPGEVGEAHA